MGVHHAREWPSGEHAMEWAFELVRRLRRDDAQITSLVKQVRTIVIPIVNVDGFNLSREAPVDLVEDPEYQSLPGARRHGGVPRRPGVRLQAAQLPRRSTARTRPAGICAAADVPRRAASTRTATTAASGAAPARAPLPAYDTYRGAGPFSEPETQNIRELDLRRAR